MEPTYPVRIQLVSGVICQPGFRKVPAGGRHPERQCTCVQSAPSRSVAPFDGRLEDQLAGNLSARRTDVAGCLVGANPRLGVQSVTHLTRLETRTKEFKVHASHWAENPKAQ